MVATITFTGTRSTVYNLEVEGLHNYAVGPNGVLVHNINCFENLPDFITRNFTNPSKIGYHWKKHAEKYGKSLEEYMNDALEFFQTNKQRGKEITTEIGTGIKIEGAPGGIFSKDGRIVTFWYD